MQESAKRLPQLYRAGQRNESFSAWVLLGWLAAALWESAVVFYVSAWTLQAAVDRSGVLVGMWGAGTLAYTLIATIVGPPPQSAKLPRNSRQSRAWEWGQVDMRARIYEFNYAGLAEGLHGGAVHCLSQGLLEDHSGNLREGST